MRILCLSALLLAVSSGVLATPPSIDKATRPLVGDVRTFALDGSPVVSVKTGAVTIPAEPSPQPGGAIVKQKQAETGTTTVGVQDRSSWTILRTHGVEHQYQRRVWRHQDGTMREEPGTLFIGDRIFRDAAGQCFLESTTLSGQHILNLPQAKYEFPVIATAVKPVDCPA